jgi:hypothetical protein
VEKLPFLKLLQRFTRLSEPLALYLFEVVVPAASALHTEGMQSRTDTCGLRQG